MDPKRQRHREYKEHYAKTLAAKRPDDLLEQYTPEDVSAEAFRALVQAKTQEASIHYGPTTVFALDLLVYVNLKRVHEIVGGDKLLDGFEPHGFRSVSAIKGHTSVILSASLRAPDFLRKDVGRLVSRYGE